MGTGIGINCERCGSQLDWEEGFETKEDGYKNNLCGKCLQDFKKEEWDRKNPY